MSRPSTSNRARFYQRSQISVSLRQSWVKSKFRTTGMLSWTKLIVVFITLFGSWRPSVLGHYSDTHPVVVTNHQTTQKPSVDAKCEFWIMSPALIVVEGSLAVSFDHSNFQFISYCSLIRVRLPTICKVEVIRGTFLRSFLMLYDARTI